MELAEAEPRITADSGLARPSSGRPGLAPVEQLRELLCEAKRSGLPFDAAWSDALAAVRWPCRRASADEHREAICATESEWRAAYAGEPTAASRLLSVLLAHLAAA